MELVAILAIPTLASALTLSPLGRRIAAPLTLISALLVFLLSVLVANSATRTGQTLALNGWLACDGLGALVLVL